MRMPRSRSDMVRAHHSALIVLLLLLAVLYLCIRTSATNSEVNSTTPTPTSSLTACNFSVSPTSATYQAAGGDINFTVTYPTGFASCSTSGGCSSCSFCAGIVNQTSNCTTTAMSCSVTRTIRVHPNPLASSRQCFFNFENQQIPITQVGTASCSVQLSTPLYQADTRWANEQYDDSNKTIQAKGCALTALTMALQHAGINALTGINIDPLFLNDYMVAAGLFSGSNVNWSPFTHEISDGKLVFDYFKKKTTQALDSALCQGFPVIVGVNLNAKGEPSHYVLVTGKQDGKYLIADPGHSDDAHKTLDAYGNNFETRGSVIPANTAFTKPAGSQVTTNNTVDDQSALDIAVDDNVQILVTDPLGRRTGLDSSGVPREEIPGSVFFIDSLQDDVTNAPPTEAARYVYIPQPLQGNYRVEVTGVSAGPYELRVRPYAKAGFSQPPFAASGTIGVGGTGVYTIQFTSSPQPALISSTDLSRALALDSAIWTREPFSVTALLNLGMDQRTRVSLFAANLNLNSGDVVAAQAEDSQGQIRSLPVEYVGRVPKFNWITQVVVKLPDQLAGAGDVRVSLTVGAASTNKLLLNIK